MCQILNRISHIKISFLCLFTVEDFFDKEIRNIDLITILHLLEYDNKTICNPRDVNHHNANTGDVTYIELYKRCEEVVDDPQFSKTQDLPFRSFEFVLYKMCGGEKNDAINNDEDTFFEVTSTTSKQVTEKKKGVFVSDDKNDDKCIKAMKFLSGGAANLKPNVKTGKHKVKDIVKSIARIQKCSKYRLGIVDGLHRLTAFSNILRDYEDAELGNQYCNIELQCIVHILKPNIDRKESRMYQHLFRTRSQNISESAAKAMPHTLFDTITEIIRNIQTRQDCNYTKDIENTNIIDFMKKITAKDPHRSFCEQKYFDVFKYAQLKLLQDCKEYEKIFESRFFQLGRQSEKPKEDMYENEYLKEVFHRVMTTPHTDDGIKSLINGDIVQCDLQKKRSFSLACASVHRFISAYMTFGDDMREEWILGFQAFQRCGLANFPSIQLTVAYAEVLATTLVQGFKLAKNKRDLNIGRVQFERILSNYFIIELLKGIQQMERIPGRFEKILDDWGMNSMPKEKGEESENICCQWLTEEHRTNISWKKNQYMTMMGIYFNYAKCILSQPFVADSDCGFIKLLLMKKNELEILKDCNGLFELSANLTLEKRRNVSETPKCMYTRSQTVDRLPLYFDSFIRQIYRSYQNGTIEVYQQHGAWPIYHPINVVQRYRTYKNVYEKNKKNPKQMEIILSPNETYDNYQQWYEITEDFNEEECTKISLRIISAIETSAKNMRIISNILKEEKELKAKEDDNEASLSDYSGEESDSEKNDKDEEEHENDKGGRKKRKIVTKQIAKKKTRKTLQETEKEKKRK